MKPTLTVVFAALMSTGVAMAQTANSPTPTGVGAADSTNSKSAPTLQTWMSDYSRANKGYISRKAYMDEMNRRWEAMDRNNQGLTMDQINSMYGYTQPNPGMVHGQTNATNPSGTEPKGQNSGGK
jgi:hypothetical protein